MVGRGKSHISGAYIQHNSCLKRICKEVFIFSLTTSLGLLNSVLVTSSVLCVLSLHKSLYCVAHAHVVCSH